MIFVDMFRFVKYTNKKDGNMLSVLGKSGSIGIKVQQIFRAKLQKMLEKDPNFKQNPISIKKLLDQIFRNKNLFEKFIKKPDACNVMQDFAKDFRKDDFAKYMSKKDNIKAHKTPTLEKSGKEK